MRLPKCGRSCLRKSESRCSTMITFTLSELTPGEAREAAAQGLPGGICSKTGYASPRGGTRGKKQRAGDSPIIAYRVGEDYHGCRSYRSDSGRRCWLLTRQ